MKKIRGVTLVELLIVSSLIAFLAMIGIIYLRSQIFKGNDARRKSDLRRIQLALEEYEKDRDCYPVASNTSCTPGTFLNPYLEKIPCAYKSTGSYLYDSEAGTCPKWYRLFAKLENTSDPDAKTLCIAAGSNNFFVGSANAPDCPSGG